MDSWIVSYEEIKSGEPVVRGSRVSVYALAERIERGESDSVLEEDFQHIPAARAPPSSTPGPIRGTDPDGPSEAKGT
jgi:predicted RecA/RadA family phage recombinase